MKSKSVDSRPAYNVITINNSFLVYGMGFGFWLIITGFIFYAIFFSDLIVWEENKTIYQIIEKVLMKSLRPIIIFLLWVVMTLFAIKSLISVLKSQKYMVTEAR